MSGQPLPSDVKKALDLLRGDLARRWSVNDLARLCRIPRRTLEKHFRRFVGRAPMEFLRTMRLDQARRSLLRAAPGTNVTGVATECGLAHLGRFAVAYRNRFGESPSATLKYRRIPLSTKSTPFRWRRARSVPHLRYCRSFQPGRGQIVRATSARKLLPR
jgi:transcriptional regulator GlxA family with amidase domain